MTLIKAAGYPRMGRSLGVGLAGAVPGHILGSVLGRGIMHEAKHLGASGMDQQTEDLLVRLMGVAGGATGGAVAQNLDGQFDPTYWDEKGDKRPRQPSEILKAAFHKVAAEPHWSRYMRTVDGMPNPHYAPGSPLTPAAQSAPTPQQAVNPLIESDDNFIEKGLVHGTTALRNAPAAAKSLWDKGKQLVNNGINTSQRVGTLGMRTVGNVAATAPTWGGDLLGEAVAASTSLAANRDHYWDKYVIGKPQSAGGKPRMIWQPAHRTPEASGNFGSDTNKWHGKRGLLGTATASLAGGYNGLVNTGSRFAENLDSIAAFQGNRVQGRGYTEEGKGRWTPDPDARYGSPPGGEDLNKRIAPKGLFSMARFPYPTELRGSWKPPARMNRGFTAGKPTPQQQPSYPQLVKQQSSKPGWLERGAAGIVNSDLVSDYMSGKVEEHANKPKTKGVNKGDSGGVQGWLKKKVNSEGGEKWLQGFADKRLGSSVGSMDLQGLDVKATPLWRRLVSGSGVWDRNQGLAAGTYDFGTMIPAWFARMGTDGVAPYIGGGIDKLVGRGGNYMENVRGYQDPESGHAPDERAARALQQVYAQDNGWSDIKADLVKPWLPIYDRATQLWNRVTR